MAGFKDHSVAWQNSRREENSKFRNMQGLGARYENHSGMIAACLPCYSDYHLTKLCKIY